MPMGLVTDSEFEQELDRLSRVNKPEIREQAKRGRTEKDVNTPESLRKIIGETSVIDGRQEALALAKEFGISPSSVSAYARGATSTASYNNPTQSIIQHINKSRQRAIKRASRTLNAALGAITQDKLDYADASDLSGIAKDMSAIIKNLEPEKATAEEGKSQMPQFVIYAPQFRKEESFEVIDVKE